MRNPKDMERKSSVPGADIDNWSQKWAKSIRPQKPSDMTQGMVRWSPGEVPKGGFRSVICFEDGNYSTKISNTSKPGNAGKKRII